MRDMSNTTTIRHVPSTLRMTTAFVIKLTYLDYKMANGKSAMNRNSKGSHTTAMQIGKRVTNEDILYQ